MIFVKRCLQTVLPKELRRILTDKLFAKFVGVDEAVFARELYLDAAQLSSMKRHGMYVGLHGRKHEWLGNMPLDEAIEDINHSLGYMDSIGLVDKKSWVMCYPSGSYNKNVLRLLRGGCLAGLTTEVAFASKNHDKLLLPRLDKTIFRQRALLTKTYKLL